MYVLQICRFIENLCILSNLYRPDILSLAIVCASHNYRASWRRQELPVSSFSVSILRFPPTSTSDYEDSRIVRCTENSDKSFSSILPLEDVTNLGILEPFKSVKVFERLFRDLTVLTTLQNPKSTVCSVYLETHEDARGICLSSIRSFGKTDMLRSELAPLGLKTSNLKLNPKD
jgi:hypothetical protein